MRSQTRRKIDEYFNSPNQFDILKATKEDDIEEMHSKEEEERSVRTWATEKS